MAGFWRVAVAAAALMLIAAIAEARTRYPQPLRNPVPYVARLWGPTGVPTAAVAQFVNARDGWLVAAEGAVSGDVVGEFLVDRVQSGPEVLLRTTDGGGRWRQVARVGASVAALDFVSPEEGYLLLKSGGTGDARGTMTLLEASDGGRTWHRLRLSRRGVYATISFADRRHGWIDVYPSGEVFGTDDGGKVWHAAAAAPATFAELFPGGRGVLLRRTDGAPRAISSSRGTGDAPSRGARCPAACPGMGPSPSHRRRRALPCGQASCGRPPTRRHRGGDCRCLRLSGGAVDYRIGGSPRRSLARGGASACGVLPGAVRGVRAFGGRAVAGEQIARSPASRDGNGRGRGLCGQGLAP